MILKKYISALQQAINKRGLAEAFDIYARTEVSKDDITVIRLKGSLLKFELWNTHNNFESFAIDFSEFSPLNKDWAGISSNNLKNNFYWVLDQFELWLDNHVKVYLEERQMSDSVTTERIIVKTAPVNFTKSPIDSKNKILFISRLSEIENYLQCHKDYLNPTVYKEIMDDLNTLTCALKDGMLSFRAFYKLAIGTTSLWVGEDALDSSVANGITNFLINGERTIFDLDSNYLKK